MNKKFLVIGNPIEHSLSPKLHNHWIKKNNLEASYDKKLLEQDEIQQLIFDLREENAFDFEKWNTTEQATALYFLMKTGFNGIWQINKNTNGRYGTPSGLLNQKDKVYDRDVVQWWHNALQKTDIHCGDWKEAVKSCPDDTFFFFDPPYRESFANYGNGFTDNQLIDLIEFCDSQSSVMMSNRDDEDWFAKQNHTLNSANFDIFYTAGRRKKTDEGYDAKKRVDGASASAIRRCREG